MSRRDIPSGFINTSVSVALWALLLGSHGSAASIEAASPVKPYYDFLYYASVGDVEHALAQFADDAVVVTGGACTVERPCSGKAAIKERYIEPMLQRRGSLPLAQRYDGLRMHTLGTRGVQDRQIFEFREGQIVSVYSETVSGVAPTIATR